MANEIYLIFLCIPFSIIEIYVLFKLYSKKKYNYVIETIIVFILGLLFLIYEYFSNTKIPILILVFVIITMIVNTYIGYYLDFYHRSKRVDRFIHLLGSFSLSLFAYAILYNIVKPINYSKLYVSIFIFTLGVTIGAVYEIIEFIQDTLFKTKAQNGLKDTDFDLIFNVIGSTIAAIVSSFFFT